jgi:hypothetical protein
MKSELTLIREHPPHPRSIVGGLCAGVDAQGGETFGLNGCLMQECSTDFGDAGSMVRIACLDSTRNTQHVYLAAL